MMQYYPYLLIFVVMDVISMFLFAWATTTITLSSIDSSLAIGTFPSSHLHVARFRASARGEEGVLVAEQLDVKKGPAAARDGPGLSILVGKAKQIIQEAIADPVTYLANWGRTYSLLACSS